MTARSFPQQVSPEELSVLNGYPEGTIGHAQDAELIAALHDLCIRHGYGRVPQVASAIEDLWRYPEKADEYKVTRDQRLRLFKEGTDQ